MAGNKHAAALSMDNEQMSEFAKAPQVSPFETLLKSTIGKASASPDVLPTEQHKFSDFQLPEDIGTNAHSTDSLIGKLRTAEAQLKNPVHVSAPPMPMPMPVREAPIAPREQSSIPDRPIASDPMSYTVPHQNNEPNRGGRPRHGAERKVERTISMDKSLDKALERLSIIESVRLDRKVSTAEVAVHLMMYGLSQITNNEILPSSDGSGLQVETNAPLSVSLPKLGAY